MKNINNYNIEIKPASHNFFLVYLYPKVDIKSNTTCLFLEEVIGLKNNNLFDYIDMKNFTDYYLQCLQIKNKENLKNFPVYNPITNGCDYFINIEKGNADESNLLLILVVDPVFSGYKNLVFNYEKKINKYHLIFYKNYDFDNLTDEIILRIQSQFDFLRNLDYNRINIEDKGKIIYEDEYKYIKIYPEENVACIFDKKQKRLQCKYHISLNKGLLKVNFLFLLKNNNLTLITRNMV